MNDSSHNHSAAEETDCGDVQGSLNKHTSETFENLVDQVSHLKIDTGERPTGVTELLLELIFVPSEKIMYVNSRRSA